MAIEAKGGPDRNSVTRRQTLRGRPRARHDSSLILIGMTTPAWPLFDLRLQCRGLELRLVRESDLARLAEVRPDDFEHDPRAEMFGELDTRQNSQRLVYQEYWRSLGTWSPPSWCLDLAVESEGVVVGVQSLEASQFPTVRTVDSGSWLIHPARGRGFGVAMRMAALALAFDQLGALAAITSADTSNAASLGVSRRIGYLPNGVSLVHSAHGRIELTHLRLPAADWRAAGHGREVTVTGFEPCRPWFGLPPSGWPL
jgi:RimJ/RimL family protein N-acetyltransferase